ncbi:unnamed protein product [marine sediment metagenome]|uniref:Uncharacterized protein n=1 Tax=marine sediment metagenome TaxID=412755 RepID=X1BJS1_9ZZZZ
MEEWFEGMTFMEEATISDPPNKHQAQVRYLQKKIKYLMQLVQKNEGA